MISKLKSLLSSLNWLGLCCQFIIGLIFIIFSVPGFLRYMARHWIRLEVLAYLLEKMADFPHLIYSVFGQSSDYLFVRLLKISGYCLGVYLLGIAVLAACKRDRMPLFASALGLFAGVLSVPAILWGVQLIIWGVQLIIWIFRFLHWILVGIGAVFVLIEMVGSILDTLQERFGSSRKVLIAVGLITLVVVIVLWLAWPYVKDVVRWLGGLILRDSGAVPRHVSCAYILSPFWRVEESLISRLIILGVVVVVDIIASMMLIDRQDTLVILVLVLMGALVWFVWPYVLTEQSLLSRLIILGAVVGGASVCMAIISIGLDAENSEAHVLDMLPWVSILILVGALVWFAWPYVPGVTNGLMGSISKLHRLILATLLIILISLCIRSQGARRFVGNVMFRGGEVLIWIGFEVVLVVIVGIVGILIIALSIAFSFLMTLSMLVGIIALLGNIVLDDFRAAWEGGKGPRGVFTAAFGIGLSISMIFLSSLGSFQTQSLILQAWGVSLPLGLSQVSLVALFSGILPGYLRQILQGVFSAGGASVFDAVLLVAVIGVNYLGLARGLWMYDKEDEFTRFFVSNEAGILAISPVLALVLAIALSVVPSEPSQPPREAQVQTYEQRQQRHETQINSYHSRWGM